MYIYSMLSEYISGQNNPADTVIILRHKVLNFTKNKKPWKPYILRDFQGFPAGGGEGQPVLTTKLSREYIYSFRGDNSLLK